MELTHRNLLMVSERGFDGRVKTVRIHDLLRKMSIRKAVEEKFLVESGISSPGLTDELLIGYVNCFQRALMGLLEYEDINNLMDPREMDQLMILNMELRSLVIFLNYYGQEKLFADDRIQLQAISCNIRSLIYSVFNNGYMEIETNLLQLPDLIEKVRATKTQLLRILLSTIFKKLMQACPHTDPLGFLNFLIGNIKELISSYLRRNIDTIVVWTTILKDLILVESCISIPALTDELLIGYVNCIQLILRRLLKDEDINNLMDPTKKDQLMILNKDLGPLVALLNCYGQEKLFDNDRIQLQAISCNIGSLIYSVFNNGNMATETNLKHLIEKVSAAKTQFQRISVIILKKLIQASPHTDLLGFLNFLIQNIKEPISCNLDSILVWKDQFQEIHEGLVFFRSFLLKVKPSSTTEALRTRMRIAAYMAEYLIDSFFVGYFPVWCRSTLISVLTEEIKLIKDDIGNTVSGINRENVSCDALIPISDSSKDSIGVCSPTLVAEGTDPMQTVDVVVGFGKEIEVIKSQLTSNSKDRDGVSITGMPGLGKTTLARKVYEDPYIVNHFDYRAWCCFSQEFYKRDVLLTILKCVAPGNNEIHTKSDEDLSEMLHKKLFGRRYLIVMDDVWVKNAFEELQLFFPDNRNGSRLMLTSRDKSVGALAKHHFELGLLTEELSWDLLQQKVFQKEKCPSELCQVGKEIARKCNGLPLAIVVIGGLLATSNKKLESWDRVAENLHITLDSQQPMVEALDLSYKFLPEHLKPLFLYLGAFPEDEVILAETLKWLWIAEGFLQNTDGKRSLEEEAEINLMDLTYRNLVMVDESRYDGRIITVRIHDLLREMSIKKAEEEMFLHQVHLPASGSEIAPDCPIYSCYRVCNSLSGIRNPKRALVSNDDLQRLSMAPPMHSFLCFQNKSYRDYKERRRGLALDFRSYKLLRVLHFNASLGYDNLISDTILLVQLRYISMKTVKRKMPSSISSLAYLETLIVKAVYGEFEVPVEIWEMVKLRHIHITPRAHFIDAPENSSSKLENLQTLSTPVINYGKEKNFIRRIPNVRELKCTFNRICKAWSLQLKSLNQLESLELYAPASTTCHSFGHLSLPSTLKELTIASLTLRWKEITSFKNLPNLQALKLHGCYVDDRFWELGNDDVFPKLKILEFISIWEIRKWIATADNFPCLQKLVIDGCWNFKEIPYSIGEIDSLLEIEVHKCRRSVKKSARKIQKYQKDLGNDSLIVRISRCLHPEYVGWLQQFKSICKVQAQTWNC